MIVLLPDRGQVKNGPSRRSVILFSGESGALCNRGTASLGAGNRIFRQRIVCLGHLRRVRFRQRDACGICRSQKGPDELLANLSRHAGAPLPGDRRRRRGGAQNCQPIGSGRRCDRGQPRCQRNYRSLVKKSIDPFYARRYQAGDLADTELAFVATDVDAMNAAVYKEGRERAVWINAADDPARCDFIFPSVLRRGDLTVAVSTGGQVRRWRAPSAKSWNFISPTSTNRWSDWPRMCARIARERDKPAV